MIRQSIYVLILTFFLVGCVERGQLIEPNSYDVIQNTQEDNQSSDTIVRYRIKKDVDVQDALYTIDDMSNNVSGVLILIIGVIIFL
ncbi:MAG: hypothetical protein DSZ12_02520 [Sulfurovum sp.]|nr:MAG: hypothetical protein DSZ12_02520 [Sulfurovum sp.]